MTIVQEIKNSIEKGIEQGKKHFIICPFGDIGIQVKNILNNGYGIRESLILDNHLCRFNPGIKEISFLEKADVKDCAVILACLELTIYRELSGALLRYVPEDSIIRLASMDKMLLPGKEAAKPQSYTKAGQYSYGNLCNHWLVESVGAFCSFAPGTDVVENHAMKYITTHPMIYCGG